MTFHNPSGGDAIVRMPMSTERRESLEHEFLRLLATRARITDRLHRLAVIIEGGSGPMPMALPLSGLAQAAPGILLFKGGHHAS